MLLQGMVGSGAFGLQHWQGALALRDGMKAPSNRHPTAMLLYTQTFFMLHGTLQCTWLPAKSPASGQRYRQIPCHAKAKNHLSMSVWQRRARITPMHALWGLVRAKRLKERTLVVERGRYMQQVNR